LLDIETSPNIVYSWGIFNQNISIDQVIEPTKVLCWAAKWVGDRTVHFASLKQRKPLQMVAKIHKLLDEADVVVHYNGRSFDIKHLNREFLEYGFAPPSPYKQVDLLQTARQNFKFLSNKLQYVLKRLELGSKAETGGFKTWVGCLKGVAADWDRMRKYNVADVVELEKVYWKFLPWIKNHPNRAYYEANKEQCPHCGSEEFQERGYYRGQAYTYKKYSCSNKGCRKWFRGTKSEGGRQAKYTGVN
jgi:hypothetical protein